MQAPDPKREQSQASGEASKNAYPLDKYTVQPSQEGNQEKQSPFYKSSAPSISMPKGGGALKGIDEKFSVNAINGTSSLQVPLPLSSGRSGFTPNLSLQYNSGGGNSEFGLGWSLSLPAIQRKTDKKLPKYDDINNSDIFVLSGAEDLQPLLVYNSLTGTWNADVQTGISEGGNLYTIKRYRPRIEGVFARIEFIIKQGTSNSWWKITTKDNAVTFYGLSASARISDPQNASRIFKWLPEVCYDNKGNVQQYFYTTENTISVVPAGLHERNRGNGKAPFTNAYLQRVKYCNLTPYSLFGHSYDISSVLPSSSDFLMEAVLDYGNYDPVAPTPSPSGSLSLPARVDPFSDFHAGFEIRTYRKCMRVLMFHYFRELNGGSPVLVRSLDMTYFHSGSGAYAEADYITSFVQNGYVLQSGAYIKRSLPPFNITYQQLNWNSTVNNISKKDAENAPQGLTGNYQWIDLWGEGLPGILSEQGNGWFYKGNLGNGHFSPAVSVAEKPSFQGLGSSMQWQDLDGDGRRQLVSRNNATPGYFELNDDQEWESFRAFHQWINVDWNSQYTKILDLDGDGRADVLITEDTVWKWYENAGTEGYKEGGHSSTSVDEEKGPQLLFNDMMQTIFLADMNGDGMTDIVRIKNGEVCYWPNMGYGNFGAKVAMSSAPWFDTPDNFDPQYVTLADISGTGAADLIYIGHGKCTAWLNLAGNAWATGVDISTLPGAEPYSKITVTDFLGSGTACIVWSSPLPQHAWAPMRYIDLMGGNKPYLMTSYSNNMGKTVSFSYQHSTQYYLQDKQAGTPWATMLPFPVHCVSQVITSDSVSETSYTQQYTYHHGYYDHEEREFRGFGRVDTIDTDVATAVTFGVSSPPENDLSQAAVCTKTWYHTGAWMREQTLLDAFKKEYCLMSHELPATLSVLPATGVATLSDQDQREAYRAIKGQPIRQEVYALDGPPLQQYPYTVTSYAYTVQQVQPVSGNVYGSFFSYKQQGLTFACERNVNDPRVMHELTLAVDIYGNVLNAATVCYPRTGTPSPPVPSTVSSVQSQLLVTYTLTDYTSDVTTGGYHLRLPYQERMYQLTGLTIPSPPGIFTPAGLLSSISGATAIDYTATPGAGVYARLLSRSITLFLGNDGTTIKLPGAIESLGIPYQKYHLALTNTILTGAAWYNNLVTGAMLTGAGEGGYISETSIPGYSAGTSTNYWLPGGTVTYDTTHFFVPTSFTDPWGNTTTVTYWNSTSPPGTPDYYLLPQSVTDPVANVATVNEYNWYVLQPTHITDPNNNESKILYDALGMPVAAALMSKDGSTEGDTLTGIDPNNSTDIANQVAFFGAPATYASSLLKGATWRCVYNLQYTPPTPSSPTVPVSVGMIGREQHNLPAVSPPDTTLLIRLTYTDGLGRISMNKVQAAPATTGGAIRWIGSGKTIYNNKGKTVMQFEPYFSTSPLFDTTEQASYPGVSPRMHYDPLGRVIQTDMPDGSYTKTEWDAWQQQVWDNNDTITLTGNAWYDAAIGSTDINRQNTATKAANHRGTYTTIHLDTLARPFYTVQDNKDPGTSPPWSVDSYYNTYITLDILGNRLVIKDANGDVSGYNILTFSYNMLKVQVRQVSLDSGTNITLTDVSNLPLYAWDADNRRLHYTYDSLRRPTANKMEPFGGVEITLEKMVYGEGASGALANNLRGKLYQSYDGLGYKKVVAYDFKGNVLEVDEQLLSDGTAIDVDWGAGTPPALDTSVTYKTITVFDALSRAVTITDPGNNITRHVFDIGGLLSQVYVKPSGGAETAYVSAINYDAKGQRLNIAYGNGTTTAYTYDTKTFRLTRLQTTKGGNNFQDLNYWYDPVGNITYVKDAAQRALYFNNSVTLPVQDYTYDALYRLIIANGREQITAATFGTTDFYDDSPWMGINTPGDDGSTQNYTEKYTYDATGNILSLQHISGTGSYTRFYNYGTTRTNNRLQSTSVSSSPPPVSPYTYSYDNRGNITQMPHLSSITYDSRNQMAIANLGGGGMAYYQYSGGQRGRKTIINGAIKWVRVYLGSYEIYRRYTSGTLDLERTTLHVSDDTGRIAMLEVRTSGTDSSPLSLVRYIYSNHLGTATLELDNSAAIISYEEYRPYGTTSYQAMSATINAVAKRYRYTGKERDEETGLYYHGARYYIPWLGRWAAADPLETKYTPESPYNYGHNNPITWTDSTGMGANNSDNSVQTQTMVPVRTDILSIYGGNGELLGREIKTLSLTEADAANYTGFRGIRTFDVQMPVRAVVNDGNLKNIAVPATITETDFPFPSLTTDNGSSSIFSSAAPSDNGVTGGSIAAAIPLSLTIEEGIALAIGEAVAEAAAAAVAILAAPEVAIAVAVVAVAAAAWYLVDKYATTPESIPIAPSIPLNPPTMPLSPTGELPIALPITIPASPPADEGGGFKYVTYTKISKEGLVYVGRTSGYGDPQKIVNARDVNHHMTAKGYGEAIVSSVYPATIPGGYATRALDPAYWAVRGSEQVQIEAFRALGISGNYINGISPNNKKIETYMEAVKRWGE